MAVSQTISLDALIPKGIRVRKGKEICIIYNTDKKTDYR